MSKGIRPIIREHIPPLLYEVLRKNKCVSKYIENTYRYCKQLAESTCSTKWLSKKDHQRYFRNIVKRLAKNLEIAFNWAKTPEGDKFWKNVYEQYRNYVYQTR